MTGGIGSYGLPLRNLGDKFGYVEYLGRIDRKWDNDTDIYLGARISTHKTEAAATAAARAASMLDKPAAVVIKGAHGKFQVHAILWNPNPVGVWRMGTNNRGIYNAAPVVRAVIDGHMMLRNAQ